jgi:membrane protease YdiL (CAAX protease family)
VSAEVAEAGGAPDSAAASSTGENRFGLEVILVLGVSAGASGLYSLINLIDIETRPGGLKHAVATVVGSQNSRPWLDLTYQLAGVVTGIMPALLALLLLSRTPAVRDRGFGIGLDLRHPGREGLQGLGFAALIGLPGLALVYTAHRLGLNAQLDVTTIADTWYRYPVLVLSAIQNGFYEEIVVIGYLLTRFSQLRWGAPKSIVVAALVRGSYHLYQGFGGFVGNAIMGCIFGWWFTRTKRVLPLAIAHSVIDIVSFVGYALLHNHISWI